VARVHYDDVATVLRDDAGFSADRRRAPPANRDPAVFVEADRLNLARTPNPHLGFGLGTLFCPGAQRARLAAYFEPYALAATELVAGLLDRFGRCLERPAGDRLVIATEKLTGPLPAAAP
jgi:hypothetical protein